MDEVVVSIAGEQHWLWRAVDQNGFVFDVLVQRRRDTRAAQRLMTKLLKSALTPPEDRLRPDQSDAERPMQSRNRAVPRERSAP
jgi:transposase-like protein